MTIQEITALRKSGKLEEALQAAEAEFAQGANKYTASALFWCLNDLIKRQDDTEADATLERMESLHSDVCPDNALMQKTLSSIRHWRIYYALRQTPLEQTADRKKLIFHYLNMNPERPSVLHSLILGEAVKVERSAPLLFRIRDFMRMWGYENLRDEDWEQFRTNDGKVLPSPVEKLIGVFAKELKTDHVAAPDEFSELVDRALAQYPKSQNLPYSKAIVLISRGRADEALRYYKDLIMRFPSKFYLWSQSAELVNEPNLKIGLLTKALTCGAEDEFIGSVRLSLAALLISNRMLPEAAYELTRYRETYQRNGWGLNSGYWDLHNRLSAVTPAADNSELYGRYAGIADEFVYSAVPTVLAVKVGEQKFDDRIHPGRKIVSWSLRTADGIIRLRKPAKFGLNRRIPDGTPFDVKLQQDNIVWIKEHTGPVDEPWLKIGEGTVRLRTDRNGKKFAIVADSYVGERLLTSVSDGQNIRILSIRQRDDRWSAVAILR